MPRRPQREAAACSSTGKILRVPPEIWACYVRTARAWGTTAEALAHATLRAGARERIGLPPEVARALLAPSTGRGAGRSRRGR